MNPAKRYAKDIKENLHNYYANWMPTTEVRLGDVGILQDGLFFRRVTTLKDLGVAFKARKDNDPTPLELASSSGVSVRFKAAGEINESFPNIPQADAAIGFDFNREGAFVFKANECYEPSIENLLEVEKQVRNLVREGRWDNKWFLVVRTVTTPLARILVSEGNHASILLTAKGKVKTPMVSLADAHLDFEVARRQGRLYTQLGAREVTPFFQLARMKTRFFSLYDQPVLRHFSTAPVRRTVDPMDYLPADKIRGESADMLYLDVVRDEEVMPELREELFLEEAWRESLAGERSLFSPVQPSEMTAGQPSTEPVVREKERVPSLV